MNGTRRVPAMRFSELLAVLPLKYFSETSSDLLRLCGLAVRVGSSGFISGGILAIFLKMRPRYTPSTKEMTSILPTVTLIKKKA